MGGTATVRFDGDPSLGAVARRRIADLEAKWSRFRPDSEVSTLNRDRRAVHRVSADTRLLVRCGASAWSATGGAFDPSVLDGMVDWGYSVDLISIDRPTPPIAPIPAAGPSRIRVDETAGTVSLGGAGFDPGGVGKGLAADLVASELTAAGARAVLVEVAGDLRLVAAPDDDRWTIGAEDPAEPEADLVRTRLTNGGMATSSDRRRRWELTDGTTAHHLLDPRTGAPMQTVLLGVTVLAGEAWWADALTKAVLVGAVSVERLDELAASGIGRTHTGAIVGTPDLVRLAKEAA